MRTKRARALAGGAVVVTLIGAVLGWLLMRAPVQWMARAVGQEPAARLRLRAGLGAAELLGRRAVVLLGDSRLEALGAAELATGRSLVVTAGIGGATARFWRGCVAATPLGEPPSTFVVWLGVNDLVNERTAARAVLQHLRAITAAVLRGPSNRVLLLEQIPAHGLGAAVDLAAGDVNRGLAEIARGSTRVAVLPLWARLSRGAGGDGCKDCYADALHLNEHGQQFLRRLLIAALRTP